MKRKRTVAIGLVSGVVCAACVFMYLQDVTGRAEAARAEALARYGGEQVEVCVAKRDIASGEVVEAGAIETKLWVADLLPQDAVRASSEVLGKRATSPILAGEVVSQKRFEGASSSLEVPEGLSAVSVPARDVQAVGGAIEPGMKVDVYSTGATATEIIVRGAQVVSTNASQAGDQASKTVSWITLAVEPKFVQELVSAAQTTDLYFVLPGTSDDSLARFAKPASGESSEETSAKSSVEPLDGSSAGASGESSDGLADGLSGELSVESSEKSGEQ